MTIIRSELIKIIAIIRSRASCSPSAAGNNEATSIMATQTTPDLIILPSHVTSLIDPTLNVFLLSSPGHFVSPTAAHHARTVSTNDSAIICAVVSDGVSPRELDSLHPPTTATGSIFNVFIQSQCITITESLAQQRISTPQDLLTDEVVQPTRTGHEALASPKHPNMQEPSDLTHIQQLWRRTQSAGGQTVQLLDPSLNPTTTVPYTKKTID
ncbi:hypothetical protein RRG08_042856 [Elysia crispata]|uniref:Uncharacterized protein n=1 Tax=Elysia crispata TaxID=231223 RepID=A0AAE1DZ69_9GAST|nr:hypothetical protein RRG08_042856 [Elysia crispata]